MPSPAPLKKMSHFHQLLPPQKAKNSGLSGVPPSRAGCPFEHCSIKMGTPHVEPLHSILGLSIRGLHLLIQNSTSTPSSTARAVKKVSPWKLPVARKDCAQQKTVRYLKKTFRSVSLNFVEHQARAMITQAGWSRS